MHGTRTQACKTDAVHADAHQDELAEEAEVAGRRQHQRQRRAAVGQRRRRRLHRSRRGVWRRLRRRRKSRPRCRACCRRGKGRRRGSGCCRGRIWRCFGSRGVCRLRVCHNCWRWRLPDTKAVSSSSLQTASLLDNVEFSSVIRHVQSEHACRHKLKRSTSNSRLTGDNESLCRSHLSKRSWCTEAQRPVVPDRCRDAAQGVRGHRRRCWGLHWRRYTCTITSACHTAGSAKDSRLCYISVWMHVQQRVCVIITTRSTHQRLTSAKGRVTAASCGGDGRLTGDCT